MSDLTASDVLAMNNGRDSGFLEGNGIIILILFFLIFGMGNGGWNGNNAATQGALTRAELYDGLNVQDIQNQISNLNSSMTSNFAAVNLNMNTLASQMATSCCDLKTAIHAEGEATRALIQENTIQSLRDEIASKDRELLTTGLTAAQIAQTNNLENFMRTLINGCSCCNS